MFFRFAVMVAALMALALLGEWAAAAPLKVGVVAPDFTAQGNDGKDFKLSDQVGKKPIVLFFYPKDNTPGCAKEVCSVRDAFPELRKLDVTVADEAVTPEGHGRELVKVLTGLAAARH